MESVDVVGDKNEIVKEPFFKLLIWFGVSGCTDKITSLLANTSPCLICAPAAKNCASEYSAATPAPDSMKTSCPNFVNFEIISGTSATRFSPGLISFGTEIRIRLPYLTFTLIISF
ncbi:unannotated protein [freshwater metagenome]|uniref:Unannotated protein n=1 Tax=freshwater metagenome TaxID=449393 RepID=A0A6J6RRK3_9ZZZZ